MTLTKNDLVKALAKGNRFPVNQTIEIIETLLEIIKSKLAYGEDVLVSGFGKFCVKEKRERRGRNPATGKDMNLEAKRVVTFKCSGRLRDKINEELCDGQLRATILITLLSFYVDVRLK